MMKWLHTIRWKNLIIIWISILVVVAPHFDPEQINLYLEFILWAIICSSVAAIGNITNDLLDIKQDSKNKKKNIFIGGKHKKTAYILIAALLLIISVALIFSYLQFFFTCLTVLSLVLLLLYNLFLKKIALIGNVIIALLTALIFFGIDIIVISRISYLGFGFKTRNIELLGYFAFITTFIREIIKDAEDRKGDSFARFKTIAQLMNDKWIALLIVIVYILGLCTTLYIMKSRNSSVNFILPFIYYAVFTFAITMVSTINLLTTHPSRYVRATRIIKAGMLGCLVIYLFLSL